jgi:hypothetical protein
MGTTNTTTNTPAPTTHVHDDEQQNSTHDEQDGVRDEQTQRDPL